MRIFFSVGEPSGDLHGSNLIRRLKTVNPEIECVGYGGPRMAEAGCHLHFELTTLAVMFISGALANIRTFFRLIDRANDFLRDNRVDAVVLIDYPGFNWWIARKAKKHGIPVFYYGVPQVWAWAPWRVRKIRKLVDHVLCKLPFEVEWFAQRRCQATYVGHPYFDQLVQQTYDPAFTKQLATDGQLLLTLLPGSRDSEVKTNLPILLNAAEKVLRDVDNVKVAVACFNQRQLQMADEQLNSRSGGNLRGIVELHVGKTPELIKSATVCLACSGSVSMELLYHRKPTVIVYKISRWVMLAQSFVLRTRFITLVNLIATSDIRKKRWLPYDPDAVDAEPCAMPEYMTAADPSSAIAAHAITWLTDESARERKIAELNALAKLVAKPGASRMAADYILGQLRSLDTVTTSGSRDAA